MWRDWRGKLQEWCHERFVCDFCHKELGRRLGDVKSINPLRPNWCLRCAAKVERGGAGSNGPNIVVWDEEEISDGPVHNDACGKVQDTGKDIVACPEQEVVCEDVGEADK